MAANAKKRVVLLRLEPEFYDALASAAATHERTVPQEIRLALRKYLSPAAITAIARPDVEPRFKR